MVFSPNVFYASDLYRKPSLNIETTEPTLIQIINAIGQILKEQQINTIAQILIEDLSAGIYFLKVGNQIKKIIKR